MELRRVGAGYRSDAIFCRSPGNDLEPGLLEMRIDRKRGDESLPAHEFEPNAVYEAQVPTVLTPQPFDTLAVELGVDPLHPEDWQDRLIEVARGREPETMLEERHRLDQHKRRCPDRAPCAQQPLKLVAGLMMRGLVLDKERVKRGGVGVDAH